MSDSNSEQVNPSSKKSWYILTALVVIVLIALGLWYWHDHSKSNKNNQNFPPVKLTSYKADKYGFSFNYPVDWSSPQFNAYNQSSGSQDEIIFPANSTTKYTVVATVDVGPENASGLSQSSIKQTLAGPKKDFIKHDSSSYATALLDSKTNAPAQINITQIANLPKLNASAVEVEVILNPAPNCPANALATDGTAGCFTESDYNNVSQFAKSFKQI